MLFCFLPAVFVLIFALVIVYDSISVIKAGYLATSLVFLSQAFLLNASGNPVILWSSALCFLSLFVFCLNPHQFTLLWVVSTLFGLSAISLVGCALSMLTIFLLLEIISYSFYLSTSAYSSEAAFLYFVVGSLSSSFIFLGIVFSLE